MPLIDRIWYTEHRDPSATTPPLLLIHGAGGSHLDWPAQLRRMNALALDLPGHGSSPGPGHYTIDAYVDDVLRLLDTLYIGPVIPLGFSMGGAVALRLALRCPERVAGLVLLASGGEMPVNPALLDGLRCDYQGTLEKLVDWQWSAHIGEDIRHRSIQRLKSINPDVIRGDYVAAASFDVLNRLCEIRVPTLLIAGTNDRMMRLDQSEKLLAGMPDARLVVIEGGSHLMALEQPEAIAGAVRDWLREFET
jgi:pimeloyl-ACP methyl ester carboxylesterase